MRRGRRCVLTVVVLLRVVMVRMVEEGIGRRGLHVFLLRLGMFGRYCALPMLFFFFVNTTNIYPTDFYVAHRSLLIRLRNRGRLRRLFLLYFDLFFYFGPW